MNDNGMKKLALLILIPLFFSCNGRSSKPATDNAQPPADTVNTRNGAEHNEYNGNSPSFAELVSKIPITPLPYCEHPGFDAMTTYDVCNEPPLAYDSLNSYGLKDYFNIHRELDLPEPEGSYLGSSWTHYFVKRFPPLKNGNELLLFFQDISNDKKKWILLECKPTGKLVCATNYQFLDINYRDVGFIDKDYSVYRKLFLKPRPVGEIYNLVIADQVNVSKSALIITSYSKTKYRKNEELSSLYFWRNNQAVEYGKSKNDTAKRWMIVKGDTIAINKNAEPTGVDAVK